MAHVHEHAEALRAVEKVLSPFAQPFAGLAGAGKTVRQVPHERDHPHALFIGRFQKTRILTDGLRALDG